MAEPIAVTLDVRDYVGTRGCGHSVVRLQNVSMRQFVDALDRACLALSEQGDSGDSAQNVLFHLAQELKQQKGLDK